MSDQQRLIVKLYNEIDSLKMRIEQLESSRLSEKGQECKTVHFESVSGVNIDLSLLPFFVKLDEPSHLLVTGEESDFFDRYAKYIQENDDVC